MECQLMANSFRIQPQQGEFVEFAAIETVAETPVDLDLEPSDNTNTTSFTFSETASDNGTAGDLDGTDGMIYNGPSGNYVQVTVANLDIAEGTIAPAAGSSVAAAVYINSTLYDIMNTEDSRVLTGTGFVAEIDTGIAVEFNYDAMVGPLAESDVIRFALLGGGEGTIDWDVDVAVGEWSIS